MTKNDEQITALAREYAEEGIYVQIVEDDAAEFLRWLTRRFCLVEKEQVKNQLKYAKKLLDAHDYNKQCIGVGCKGIITRIFPEIAKEVKG